MAPESPSKRTYYEVLGVSPVASAGEIKKRYRDLARTLHPDVSKTSSAESDFRLVNEAYRVLSDTDRRNVYDSELKLAELKRRPMTDDGRRKTENHGPDSVNRHPSSVKDEAPNTQHPTPDTRHPIPAAEVLVAQAETAYRRMRFRDAELLCRQALRIDRRNAGAYEILGDVQWSRGRTDDAVAMYSYALQLDRGRRSVQLKFDKLVGQKAGPTVARNAGRRGARAGFERTGRRPHPGTSGALQGRAARATVSVVGLSIVAALLIAVRIDQSPPPTSPMPLQWDPLVLFGLAAAGGVVGFLGALNGILERFRDSIGEAPRIGPGRFSATPYSIAFLFAALWFCAGIAVYLAIGFVQNSVSRSIIIAFALALLVAGLFALQIPAGAAYLLLTGGNLTLLTLTFGWGIGDRFRA